MTPRDVDLLTEAEHAALFRLMDRDLRAQARAARKAARR